MLISTFFHRELTWAGVRAAAVETLGASAGILLIVAVARCSAGCCRSRACRSS